MLPRPTPIGQEPHALSAGRILLASNSSVGAVDGASCGATNHEFCHTMEEWSQLRAVDDIEQPGALERYLRQTRHLGVDERVQVERLDGGVSNRTLKVTRETGEVWVVKQALEKLRVDVDWFSDPGRAEREAEGLRWLARLAPHGAITPLIFYDEEHHIVAMEAVPEPHDNWKTLLLAGNINSDYVEQFGRLLGRIHGADPDLHDDLAADFADRSYFESLRLEPYYGYAAEQVADAAPFLRRLMKETRARSDALVHGDYSPKNVLIHAGQIVLLDHEVIHFGEPAFDLGFSMTHFLSKAHHLPAHRGAFAAATRSYWQAYLIALGEVKWQEGFEQRAVHHTLACLLARVEGRSPLEYLDATERARQRDAVVRLMEQPPGSVDELIAAWCQSF